MWKRPTFKECPYCLMEGIKELTRAYHSDKPLEHYRLADIHLWNAIDAYRNYYQKLGYEEWFRFNCWSLMKCKSLGLKRLPYDAYSLLYELRETMRERVKQFA